MKKKRKRKLNQVLYNNNLIEWFIVCGIFCNFYIELFFLLIILLIIVNSRGKINIKKSIFSLLIIIPLYSFISIYSLGYFYEKFIQQYVLIAISIIIYNLVFNRLHTNIESLFIKYLKVSYYVSIIGLIQFLIYLASNYDICDILYSKSHQELYPHILRISSIMDEPGYLSMALTPAVIYYIYKGSFLKSKSIVTLSCYILTFGTVSYIILILAFWYKMFMLYKSKTVILSLISIISLFTLTGIEFNSVNNKGNGLIMRVTDTINGLSSLDPNNFEGLNLSTYALLTNTWVALKAPYRITGTGLGTHSQNYESTYKSNYLEYGTNKEDGYSFLNRLYSEFGLIGCIIAFIFIIKNFNNKNIINIACLFILLTFLLRGGHYVRYGFIFWIFMYLYSNKSNSFFIPNSSRYRKEIQKPTPDFTTF